MDESEARARIEDETAWQEAPALSRAEVDRLLARARVVDAGGRWPGDDGYLPTYSERSVNRAIAAGFRVKAAKVAGQEDVRAGSAAAQRSQKAEALSRQARRYAGPGVITLTTALVEADPWTP
jgi:hypothetical protein